MPRILFLVPSFLTHQTKAFFYNLNFQNLEKYGNIFIHPKFRGLSVSIPQKNAASSDLAVHAPQETCTRNTLYKSSATLRS